MPIEQVAPGLGRIVSLDQEVEWLGSGYGRWTGLLELALIRATGRKA